ncbi:hypothetical protein IJX73_01800 [bacterium]|nr:hypothetical protein [bacterium]MBQ9149643.1 hypothetical protein [bacterium]
MRVLPVMNTNRNFVNKTNGVHNNVNNNVQKSRNMLSGHKYTGVASVDLAYASMFDSAIARDLKLMGLI